MESSQSKIESCDGEPALNSLKRWLKIQNDYKKKKGFDISKIPEIFDNVKFDLLHNPERKSKYTLELFDVSQMMCRVIVPSEFGLVTSEKIDLGVTIVHPLLKKVH